MVLAASGAVALLLSALLTAGVRRAALRYRWVVGVREDRWHREPKPALGGVAIVASFLMAGGGGVLLLRGPEVIRVHLDPALHVWTPLEGLLLAGVLLFVVGLVDDLRPLGPGVKLVAQVGGAGILVASGVLLQLTGVYPLDVALTFLWIVGVTNALNLLDNMDGLAGGVACIAALFLGVIFVLEGLPQLALVAFVLAGSVAGFLVHNHPPARIFMGDSGALFLGVFLAGLALSPAAGGGRGVLTVVAVPVLLLAVPILDTALVTAARLAEGRPLSQGGRDHLSHRLVRLGISERRAVYTLWALAAMGGGVGLLLRTEERHLALFLVGLLCLGFLAGGAFLLRVGLRERVEGGWGLRSFVHQADAWHQRVPVLRVSADAAAVLLAFYAAYLVRWDPPQLQEELTYFQEALPLVVAAKLAVFAGAGFYRPRLPKPVPLAGRLVMGSLLGSVVAVALSLMVVGFGLSRGVVAVDLLLCTLFLAALRGVEWASLTVRPSAPGDHRRPAIVAGSPEEVQLLLQMVQLRPELRLSPEAVWTPEGEAQSDPETARGAAGRDGGHEPSGPEGVEGSLRLYRGWSGLARAVEETEARIMVTLNGGDEAPVPLEAWEENGPDRPRLRRYRLDLNLVPVEEDEVG